jgi:hypothetical protein
MPCCPWPGILRHVLFCSDSLTQQAPSKETYALCGEVLFVWKFGAGVVLLRALPG